MSSSLDLYLREIDQTPLLSAQEEHELALKVQEGDRPARDHLTRANLRLVVRIARDYMGRGLALEDLISEGTMGLMRATESFDPAAGTRFSTYAAFWIKQSIRVALNKSGYVVRIPQYLATLVTKWRRMAGALRDTLGRDATCEEIAAELGLSKKQVRAIQQARKATESAQTATEESDLADLLADVRSGEPGDDLAHSEAVDVAVGSLAGLGERDATILRLRFGLNGEEPATLQDVGDRLGLTRERIRQLERASLAALREQIAA